MNCAVVGATGAVGRELLGLLESRAFPVAMLRCFASPRSIGRKVPFAGRVIDVQALHEHAFDGCDFVFFDASDAVSKEFVPFAVRSGAWVIDNSSVYRLDPQVPLIVPDVNAAMWNNSRILAGPNCTTVQLVVFLAACAKVAPLKRVVVASYQSTSGAGLLAMDELRAGTVDFLESKPECRSFFPEPIAFNCIPQIGSFDAEGWTSEETKVMMETRKILGHEDLGLVATAVRVPTLHCHAQSVFLEYSHDFTMEQVHTTLADAPGIQLHATYACSRGQYAATGGDDVHVGRLRRDRSVPFGLAAWVVSDNLRRGAALNALHIAEMVCRGIAPS